MASREVIRLGCPFAFQLCFAPGFGASRLRGRALQGRCFFRVVQAAVGPQPEASAFTSASLEARLGDGQPLGRFAAGLPSHSLAGDYLKNADLPGRLALALGWKRWAAVTICTFYAITRPGELLKMRRKHDLLQPKHPWMYFRVEKSKSRRKAAKTQHAKLSDRSALEFAVALWQDLPRSELLYPGSPGVYRRRWDSLLAMLRFLRAQSSLRAPFGLEEPSPCLFQKGLSVNDLLWRMRLKSLATLEFYLQEMSAISVLPDLPMATRRRIVTAASLFPRILQGGL